MEDSFGLQTIVEEGIEDSVGFDNQADNHSRSMGLAYMAAEQVAVQLLLLEVAD